MSDLALAPQRSALPYVIGAFGAPRLTVRRLMTEPALKTLSWQVVLISAMVSALVGILADYHNYTYRDAGTYFLPADYAIADMVLWGAFEFAIFVASFPLARFLWSYLFGYRDEERAVWAAAAMATCPAIVLDPLLEAFFLVTGADDHLAQFFMVFGVYALISALIIAVYFSAALAISYVKAAAMSLGNMLIYLISAIAIAYAVILVPMFYMMMQVVQ